MSNYHYTKAIHIADIINEGKIRTSPATGSKKVRPVVWLTKSEKWELCCTAGRIDTITGVSSPLTLEEMKEIMGVCRIKINNTLPTVSLAKFKNEENISEFAYKCFTRYTKLIGCKTRLWSCSFEPIGKEYFESVEMLVGDKWVIWEGQESIEEFVNNCHKLNFSEKLNLNFFKPIEGIMKTQFYKNNEPAIIKVWKRNKGKTGYVEVVLSEKFGLCFINFIEGVQIKEEFLELMPSSSGEEHLHMYLLWFDTNTPYNAIFAYNSDERRIELLKGAFAA